jgi:hypothetical protein
LMKRGRAERAIGSEVFFLLLQNKVIWATIISIAPFLYICKRS